MFRYDVVWRDTARNVRTNFAGIQAERWRKGCRRFPRQRAEGALFRRRTWRAVVDDGASPHGER